MEDPELIALKEFKQKLVAKAYSLLEKLKKQEDDQQVVTLKLLPDTTETVTSTEEELQQQYNYTLCEVSKKLYGIAFQNINKKWLHDNIYKYTASLITKSLSFYIELTVKLKGNKEFETCDITCHFINVDKCYMLEIESWVQTMTKMKNFSLLTSAISQYNEQNIIRKMIIDKLKGKYVSYEQCSDKNGGLLIYLHSPQNVKQMYLTFQWSILFLERTWQNEHHFIINSSETGVKFVEENNSLLKKFCKPIITKENLFDLWSKLCFAIDSYENKNSSKMDYDTK